MPHNTPSIQNSGIHTIVEVVEARKGLLFGYIAKTLRHLGMEGRGIDAEDILNEVILIACQKAADDPQSIPHEERALIAWLLRTILYVSLNAARREQSKRDALKEYGGLLTELELRYDSGLETGLGRTLRKFLETRKPRDQRLMTMALIEGYTAKEIGEKLGMSASNVRQQKHRLLEELKAYIGHGKVGKHDDVSKE